MKRTKLTTKKEKQMANVPIQIEHMTAGPHNGKKFVHKNPPLANPGPVIAHRNPGGTPDTITWTNLTGPHAAPVDIFFPATVTNFFVETGRHIHLNPGGSEVRNVDPDAATGIRMSYIVFVPSTPEFGEGEASDPEIEIKD
jgi:hypothetical protein